MEELKIPENGGSPSFSWRTGSWVRLYRRWIVLEPTIFLFLVSARMVYFTRANLFIDVVCCGMNNMTEALCGDLNEETKKQVSKESASLLEDILLLETVGPIVLCLLAGPFSDRYGRKLPLLFSCLGMSLAYCGYGLLATLDPGHDLPSHYYMLPSLAISISGQFFVFFQMFFAYTSDYSNSVQEGDRKFTRFIMAEGSVYFGAVAGTYAAGVLYENFGYQFVFFFSCGLNTLGLLYALVFMPNLKLNNNKESEVEKPGLTSQLSAAWRSRHDGKLLLVVLLIISFTLFEFPFPVDNNILYLYFKHQFHWEEEDFTNFQALWTFSMVVGQFALTPFLTKVVKLSYPLIGCLSCISKAAYYLILSVSHSRTMVYFACLAGIEGGVGNIVSRSMLARLVPQSELGKVYGLLAILDAALPFAALPVATHIWDSTIDTMPAAFCLLNAGVLCLLGLLFLVVSWVQTIYSRPYCQSVAKT